MRSLLYFLCIITLIIRQPIQANELDELCNSNPISPKSQSICKAIAGLWLINEFERAYTLSKESVCHHPQDTDILRYFAQTLSLTHRYQQAIETYDKAIEQKAKGITNMLLDKAHCFFSLGDITTGLRVYKEFIIQSSQYAYDLEDLLRTGTIAGKKVLIIDNATKSDTFFFIRSAQMLHKLGAHVIVTAREELKPFISHLPYIDTVMTHPERVPHKVDNIARSSWPLIAHDASIYLHALPAFFPECPADPYLSVDQAHITRWQSTINKTHNCLNVGIYCAADKEDLYILPRMENNTLPDWYDLPSACRSIDPTQLIDHLLKVPNIHLYCLQKDHATIPKDHPSITTFGQSFDRDNGAFIDSAAVMHHLDLVITSDSIIANLAGGLGIKTYVLVPYTSDWRWSQGHRTPWYPTVTVIRQTKPACWQQPLKELRALLSSTSKQTMGNNYGKDTTAQSLY